MAEKRKDSKGRVLKSGESQRRDGSYQYRYSDKRKNRKYIYANSLSELRRLEEPIRKALEDGLDIDGSEMSVSDLVGKYIRMKRTVKVNTMKSYSSSINRIKNSDFGQKKIKSVKTSDAKMWYVELRDQGLKRSTITGCHSILRPAFAMAVEDDILRKNPFCFKLADLLPDDSEKRVALTETQQKFYLDFIRENGTDNYYDDIVILLGTGLPLGQRLRGKGVQGGIRRPLSISASWRIAYGY